jgi:uracil-DNA glycosylase family 4
VRSKPPSCASCPCHSHGTDFSRISGTGSLGVMIVAEASGEVEAREQRPLVEYAPAGSLLERSFRRMGLDRNQFSLTNTLRCRPRNNWLAGAPWEFSALNHCRQNLDAAILERRPRAILALGDTALRELTGETGESRGISHLNGYVLLGPDRIPTVSTYHPAFIRRGKAAYQGIFARHLKRAVDVAAGRDQEWMWDIDAKQKETYGQLNYTLHPSLDEARAYAGRVRGNSGLVISYDIETYESASLDEDARDGFADTQIRLVQFSSGSGEGIALRWEGAYRDVVEDILASSNTKCGHNLWLFDNRILEATAAREGLSLRIGGPIHDTLQMFHHWQPDLPAHLQFCAQFVQFPFPWKHLAATDLEFYGCVDADATLRLYTFLDAALRREGIYDSPYDADGSCVGGYIGQVEQVRPILAGMERRGLPIDDAVRLKLDVEFQLAGIDLANELMPRFPESAKKLDPYKTFPPELKKLPESDWGQLFKEPDKIDKKTEKVKAGKWYRYGQREVAIDGVTSLRWCYIPEFNPNSAPQLIQYMKAKGYKIPKSRETDEEGNQKDTTNKKELVRLANRTGDNLFLKVIEYRELSKMRGTYIDGFAPHADGCVHTTFTFDTGIGQLSSRNPNIQNFPKHGRLASAVRRMIAAKPGHILTEWDYKSCHVLTLGFLAEDSNYIRCARIDMHSIVTGHKLGLWHALELLRDHDDAYILSKCKWLKSNPEWRHIRDARMKHAILGIGNGLKARGLYEKHMEDFSSQRDAQSFLDVAEELFPKVFAWHKWVQQLAHDQTFLKTQYGHMRRFYEVFTWNYKKAAYGHGDQAEEAISYWLSNIAFGYIREHLKELGRLGLDSKYGLCNNVHDSLVFHFPADLLDEHIREVYPVLIAPSRVLCHPTIAPDGLWIDAELNAGRNWGEMEEVNIKGALNDRMVPSLAHPPSPDRPQSAVAPTVTMV